MNDTMEKPDLVYTMLIRSTPEKTWEALSNPEFTRQYWGGMANVSDWKPGSKWQHVTKGNEPWVIGEVVECVPNKRLVLSWAEPDNPDDLSRVAFEIEKMDNLVCLTVKHSEFKPGSAMADRVSQGWPRVLSSLKSWLETGEGLNIFCGHEE